MGNRFFKQTASFFVYLLGDDGAILLLVEKGVTERRLFAPTPDIEHTKALGELIDEHPEIPIYTLVDMIDQSYVRHTLPPVASFSVKKLIQRRIDRDFNKEDITGHLPLGRETTGRKDWNFLLIALTSTPVLQDWLKVVLEKPNRFAGLHLMPVECESILAALDEAFKAGIPAEALQSTTAAKGIKKFLPQKSAVKPKKGKKSDETSWKILFTHNKTGGFRQVVLRNNRIIFTRLTQQTDNAQPEVQAGNVEQEIKNTLEYLKRLSFNATMDLDVYIIVAQEIKDNLSNGGFDDNVHLYPMTPFEAAGYLQLKQAVLSGDKFGDIVIAASFGLLKKKRLPLTYKAINKFENLYNAINYSKYIGIFATVGLLGFMCYTGYEWYSKSSDLDDLKRKEQRQQSSLDDLNAAVKDLPNDVFFVNDLIDLTAKMEETPPSPEDSIKKFEQIISERVIVNSLQWSVSQPIGQKQNAEAASIVNIQTKVNFTRSEGEEWKSFIGAVNTTIEQLKTDFAPLTLEHTPLPGGTIDPDKIQVNFEDGAADENADLNAITVQFTLIGTPTEKSDDTANGGAQ